MLGLFSSACCLQPGLTVIIFTPKLCDSDKTNCKQTSEDTKQNSSPIHYVEAANEKKRNYDKVINCNLISSLGPDSEIHLRVLTWWYSSKFLTPSTAAWWALTKVYIQLSLNVFVSSEMSLESFHRSGCFNTTLEQFFEALVEMLFVIHTWTKLFSH